MKKTLNIDDALLASAKKAAGTSTDTETVQLGLEALVRRAAYERLARLGGTEPQARDVPRRKAPPAKQKPSKKRAA
jgi:Arc/MetJ family transcription regulator